MNEKKVSGIIKQIIKLKGEGVFMDAKCFTALFDDLAPELSEERKIIHRVISDEVLESFYKAYKLENKAKKNEFLKINKSLHESMGFSVEWSSFVVTSFSVAFDAENPFIKKEKIVKKAPPSSVVDKSPEAIRREFYTNLGLGFSYSISALLVLTLVTLFLESKDIVFYIAYIAAIAFFIIVDIKFYIQNRKSPDFINKLLGKTRRGRPIRLYHQILRILVWTVVLTYAVLF